MNNFYLEIPNIKRKEDIIDYINELEFYNSEINGIELLSKILEDEDKMKEFKFVCEEEILARVAMPRDYTICMSAFTKTELKKRIPEITDYRESDNFVYGIRKIWKLKEC